jgi:class 3 adenylate cyclase
MGIHAGEATQTEAGWIERDVHRAARIAAVTHGGQVVLSEMRLVLSAATCAPLGY